ncbi:uncharacterized protein TNCV_4715001 [Trichonephila clavipes]|nr:uncharacterized protein TNCV_4715001 [Trichonephila clavipes]
MNVPKEFWVSHLLGLLPQEITQLIAREPEQEARDYDYVRIVDVRTFDKLRDLMIADQMKKRAPVEFKERHLDEWPSINCPVELAERLEEFEDL